MLIYYKAKKLRRVCASQEEMVKKWGPEMAALVAQRLKELKGCDTLADMFHLPGAKCHPLVGDRKGRYAVNLKNPYRLIFCPAHDPVPRMEDGGVDVYQVTEILIVGVEDYHRGKAKR